MLLKNISLVLIALSFSLTQSAFAQPAGTYGSPTTGTGAAPACNLLGAPVTTIRDPLLGDVPTEPPLVTAPGGQPPPLGNGPTPAPQIPGMGGNPTLLPWVPAVPANDIDLSNTGIALPVSPAVESPPGVLGPLLSPLIPAPQSTPGPDPNNLTAPIGSFNPAEDVYVSPLGGLPGTGGYCTTIPTIRRGGQQTHQWELRGRNSAMAGIGGDGSQDEVTRLGPMAGWGAPFGVPTGDGLRNSSIDLGGGTRMKVGGTKISTGSSVQDYGLSATRGNPVLGAGAQQSTEFGQGWRRNGLYSSSTTDFGFPYRQFSPANEDAQKKAQLLPPRAVETNF